MFDAFISYKNTDQGQETEDYYIAQSLFEELRNRGVKTFMSDESIFSMGKSDYKRAIDNALTEATVLIVIGSRLEYLSSGWVEYEYETFYEDILSGRKKGTLISYTSKITQDSLPRTLARHQNFQKENIEEKKVVDFIIRAMNVYKENSQFDATHNEDAGIHTQEDNAYYVRKGEKSSYISDYRNELNRLQIQAGNSKRIDSTVIETLSEQEGWFEDSQIVVLDLGSAYGFVANDRFASDPRVGKVICVDNNKRVIERAQILFAEQTKMIFVDLDIESETFSDDLSHVLQEQGIEYVHLIFSALTLHHLKDPNKALRKIRRIMDNRSWIVLRGSDDGSKLCYPKSDLMEEIIEKSSKIRGASDRFNGRKLYTQLSNAGFGDIRVFSDMKDLSNLDFDARADLFEESFAYRTNYYHRILDTEPDNSAIHDELRWMEEALEEFENQLFESNFWYCEYDYAAIARKK